MPKKSEKHNPVRKYLTAAAAAMIAAGCFAGWNFYRRGNAETVTAETLRAKLIEQYGGAARKRQAKKAEAAVPEEKQVEKACAETRPWAAVADFTIDKSVAVKISGSALAIKLEQALGNKYRLLTRSQVSKAMRELRFQASDLADGTKAKKFGKWLGAEYLISGSVIQLGRKITVACQIFKVGTGSIRQTAEISAYSIDDFNYMFHEAANILAMSKAEKRSYMEAKFNYPKHLADARNAMARREYADAVIFFNRALSAKYSDKVKKMLKLATEKAAAQRLRNQRKAKYDLNINRGNVLLRMHRWNEAEAAFKAASQIHGREYGREAGDGIKAARGGAKLIRKKQKAEKEFKLCFNYAARLLQSSGKLNKNDIKAYEKCSASLQAIADFTDSGDYRYLDGYFKSRLAELKIQAETYLPALSPPLPADLSTVELVRQLSPAGLAPGSRRAQARQKKWALKLGLPLEVKTRKAGIKLRLIPPGMFTMGSPPGGDKRGDDEKQHSVSLAKAFYCGKFELTQRQWKRVTGSNPSYFKNSGYNAPVEQVSWNDCQEFLKKLCALEGVPPGTYRLLSEAQWEYACRAGTNTPFCYGNSLDSSMANFDGAYPRNAAKGVKHKKTLAVGSFKPNAWGLYDMHGNVWEWCADYYKSYQDRVIYPALPPAAGGRVLRGGSWNIPAGDCRSAVRLNYWPSFRFNILGLRILRVIPEKNTAFPPNQAGKNKNKGTVPDGKVDGPRMSTG